VPTKPQPGLAVCCVAAFRRGLRLNEHLAHDGESVFRRACKMGLEGIVSKRLRLNQRPRKTLGFEPLPIDYEQCCSDQLNPQPKADIR